MRAKIMRPLSEILSINLENPDAIDRFGMYSYRAHPRAWRIFYNALTIAVLGMMARELAIIIDGGGLEQFLHVMELIKIGKIPL